MKLILYLRFLFRGKLTIKNLIMKNQNEVLHYVEQTLGLPKEDLAVKSLSGPGRVLVISSAGKIIETFEIFSQTRSELFGTLETIKLTNKNREYFNVYISYKADLDQYTPSRERYCNFL